MAPPEGCWSLPRGTSPGVDQLIYTLMDRGQGEDDDDLHQPTHHAQVTRIATDRRQTLDGEPSSPRTPPGRFNNSAGVLIQPDPRYEFWCWGGAGHSGGVGDSPSQASRVIA